MNDPDQSGSTCCFVIIRNHRLASWRVFWFTGASSLDMLCKDAWLVEGGWLCLPVRKTFFCFGQYPSPGVLRWQVLPGCQNQLHRSPEGWGDGLVSDDCFCYMLYNQFQEPSPVVFRSKCQQPEFLVRLFEWNVNKVELHVCQLFCALRSISAFI